MKKSDYIDEEERKTPSAPTLVESPPLEHPPDSMVPLQGAPLSNMTNPAPEKAPPPLPPPAYQEAINDSAASPYPKLEPNINNFSAMPHQSPNPYQSPNQNAAPPIPSNYGNNVGGAPPNTVIYVTPQSQQQIPIPTTHVHHNTTVIQASAGGPIRKNPCAFCAVGSVQSETDVCCIVCLFLLLILTFPLGLLFLLCIPCAIRKRCSACRRHY